MVVLVRSLLVCIFDNIFGNTTSTKLSFLVVIGSFYNVCICVLSYQQTTARKPDQAQVHFGVEVCHAFYDWHQFEFNVFILEHYIAK